MSHEVGHTFNLTHDGTATSTYYPGHGEWAPIMGTAYGKSISQFSKGEYSGANNVQDDLSIIQRHVPVMPDDHGNTNVTATTLALDQQVIGILGINDPADVFKISAIKGMYIDIYLDISKSNAEKISNLNTMMKLYNANGVLIQSGLVLLSGRVWIDFSCPADGFYYVQVTKQGAGDPKTTGYSTYGVNGQYVIWTKVW